MNSKRAIDVVLAGATAILLVACGGSSSGTPGGSVTYTVGGTVSGLTGTVVLQNNDVDNISITTNSPFSFPTAIATGNTYNVKVLTQPAGQNCIVSNGSGTVSSNVTTVSVVCGAPWAGTKQLGAATANTYAYSVANDANGNVYVAGYTDGGLDGNTLTGTNNFFVTKYNSSGEKQYTRQLGAGMTFGYSVATDASGNVYVAGATNVGLDGNTKAGTYDFFVTKYNSAGEKQYTRQLGVSGAITYGYSVATDASGNVYVAGYTNGGLDGNTLTGTYDFFVTKYNSAGVKQYTRQLGAVGASTQGHSVATDASGNVYVAGNTYGGLDSNTLMGTTDFFVTKYDSAGVKQYTRQLGPIGSSANGKSVATDASGNVFVAGWTNGALDGNAVASLDFYVTKYDAAGVKQYTRQLGVATKVAQGYSVATDVSGNVYVAGATNGSLDGNTLTGGYDLFVTKYNNAGVKQYTRQLGVATKNTYGNAVTVDVGGNVFVAGYTNGGLDGNTLTGVQDLFVSKYDSIGVKQ